ncbi:MAG: accessory gene regulator B family protein [Lachnospiraceae bacterium]|nr:accessory gene regulator B family protein [Lachnospiraceae bacterium]
MLADRIADSLYKEGIIADEEREIIRFGLESLEGNLQGVVLTLTVGICFKQVEEALLLWLLLFPLRKNAGGYHAATKTRCLLVSTTMLIIVFMFSAVFEYAMIFYGICTMAAGCVIWILAPVDNFSKKLDAVEYKVYRRRTRIALGVEGAIFVLALSFKWEMVVRSICMTLFIACVSLLVGVTKLVICNKPR